MLISVCICTYNRSSILAYCLRSIAHLTDPRPRHDVEVIVVDNNSIDQTSQVVESFSHHFPFTIRYVFESEQGLSHARNRAVLEARGDYLAFIDDECMVNPDWLTQAIVAIERHKPCFVGGPYIGALLAGQSPAWFKTDYGNAYFLKNDYGRGFHDNFRASGGNMFVRKDVFDSLRFDTTLGKKGAELNFHEEVDLQERFLRSHPSERIYYDPAMVLRHIILPEKMRLSYHARRTFAAAVSAPGGVHHVAFCMAMAKASAHLCLGPIRLILRDHRRHPFWQNVVYEQIIPGVCHNAGIAAKYFRGRLHLRSRPPGSQRPASAAGE